MPPPPHNMIYITLDETIFLRFFRFFRLLIRENELSKYSEQEALHTYQYEKTDSIRQQFKYVMIIIIAKEV